jgi:hypothetical protein
MAVLLAVWSCHAWWAQSHGVLTKAAVMASPAELPPFFRDGAELAGHLALDPDVDKNKGTPGLRAAEGPEHFIDWELLQGKPLPEGRYDCIALCCRLGVRPEKVGLLPYALTEGVERLAVAFAESRKWPTNRNIQEKCLMYAGRLGHYAEDACQPLHVSIHYDGRALADGASPKSGIHEKVDGLIENLKLTPAELAGGQKVVALDSLMRGVLAEIAASRLLVDSVYALEKDLAALAAKAPPSAALKRFTDGRGREAVRFTAALYLTAWKLSEGIVLEDWLDRPKYDAVK